MRTSSKKTNPHQPAAKADNEPTVHAPATLDGEEFGAEGEEQVAAEDRTASAIRAVREEDRLAMFSVSRDLPPPGADLSVAEYLVSAPIFVDQVFPPQVQAFCFLALPGQEELQRHLPELRWEAPHTLGETLELKHSRKAPASPANTTGRETQVDAAEAQAPLGFLEVPIISSWVRGGTESYDNNVDDTLMTVPDDLWVSTHEAPKELIVDGETSRV